MRLLHILCFLSSGLLVPYTSASNFDELWLELFGEEPVDDTVAVEGGRFESPEIIATEDIEPANEKNTQEELVVDSKPLSKSKARRKRSTAVTRPLVKKKPAKQPLQCPFCVRSFDHPSCFKRHLDTAQHKAQIPPRCSVCSVTFASGSEYWVHQQVHQQ